MSLQAKKENNPLGLGEGVYFDDPRFRMTVMGRMFVRIAAYVGYLVVVAGTATFLLSDVPWLRALGFLFVLFLLQRLNHRGEGDVPIYGLPRSGRVNVARTLSPKAFSLLERAFDKSILLPDRDFFLILTREFLGLREIRDGLTRLDVPLDAFRRKIDELIVPRTDHPSLSREELLSRVAQTVTSGFDAANGARHTFIEPGDLFAGLAYLHDPLIDRLFATFAIEAEDLELALLMSSLRRSIFRGLPKELGGFVLGSSRLRHRIMNRAWTARPTPTLDRYSEDLTDRARENEIGFLIGHKEEFELLINTLARPINPNAILIGEAGIGKETIIEHLAFRLSKDSVPPALFDRRLVSLRIDELVAGAAQDELSGRLKAIVEEIVTAGNIILSIPDIHNLVHTSGTGYLSAADALMPLVMSNQFPIVGTTFPREFKQTIEPRSDFAGAFEIIRVEEITPVEAKRLLIYESLLLERQFSVIVSFGAIRKSVLLAKKYLSGKFLPASAEEVLKGALVEAKRRGERMVGPELIISTVESKVHVPIHEATGGEAEELLHLEDTIHERLIGQDEAVQAVADALREYRSGLTRKGGPIASFLFVGPTGVGKTELAKILAQLQFGSEKAMVRFDMTEYQDKQSFYRFIGSPDGAVSGALTDAILHKPYSLVLLDEFEKAYPDILNLFLQVCDDGRLTDNLGRVADFQNTIIIATSNAHSDIINESLNQGQSMASIAEYLKKKLVDVFKPELLNRFSRIVVFHDLLPADLLKIVRINLADVAAAVKEQGMEISFDPEVITQFSKWGYEPAFGARPLRRAIDDKLKAPLASEMLRQQIAKGASIRVGLQGDALTFTAE